ncbi:MAG: hypothetical protein Fur0041_01810 [Bacteroidia bacterium]
MNRKFTLLSAAVFSFFSLGLFAQSSHPGDHLQCGTDQQLAKVFAEHPEIKAQWEENNRIAEEQDKVAFKNGYKNTERNGQDATQSAVLYVPVVFHIIHDYGTENISDAQILDQMRILNEDYRLRNSDTTAIVPQFQGIKADCEIEFRLANIDPNGNCTNGIDRIASVETYVGDDGSKLNPWPRNKYLNVWVVRTISSGAAGYAYLPGTAPSAGTDGIIILSTYVGSIGTGSLGTSRALTHEIGHFLNLQHVWGSTNNPGVSCGNDGVTDTPITKGWSSCNLTNNMICTPNVVENVQNFMEYSYCSRMFTAGQKSRMRTALNSATGQRSSLITTSNYNATGIFNNPPNACAPVADFTPVDKIMVCAGGTVNFNDISWSGQPTSWSWTFPGGNPGSSTDSMPSVQYNTPGSYAVTLTVSNASGSNTKTRTGHVIVSPQAAQYSNWNYVEGFEVAANFTNDWIIINPQSNGWTRVTTVGATGTCSARLDNTSSMVGQVDEFISPAIDMTAMTSPVMTFKVAYAQRTTGDADKLRVLFSTDCGQTWIQRYTKAGANLSTSSATTSSFVPNASQWRQETITITSQYQTATNLRIKFEFTSDGGNDIFLDDINIQGTTGINDENAGVNAFDIYPNPSQDNATIAFNLSDNENVSLQVLDMTGRVVMDVYNGDLNAGTHRFDIQTAGLLSKGIYFVRVMTADGRAVTNKLVVE